MNNIDILIQLKNSYIADIKFAKEFGIDYSSDLAKLKQVKDRIDKFMD